MIGCCSCSLTTGFTYTEVLPFKRTISINTLTYYSMCEKSEWIFPFTSIAHVFLYKNDEENIWKTIPWVICFLSHIIFTSVVDRYICHLFLYEKKLHITIFEDKKNYRKFNVVLQKSLFFNTAICLFFLTVFSVVPRCYRWNYLVLLK